MAPVGEKRKLLVGGTKHPFWRLSQTLKQLVFDDDLYAGSARLYAANYFELSKKTIEKLELHPSYRKLVG